MNGAAQPQPQDESGVAGRRPADGAAFTALMDQLRAARDALDDVIFGQKDVVTHALTTLLSGGHALLVGAPGLGKTLLARSLATVMGVETRRIQCTPDLTPADVLGGEILDEQDGRRSLRFVKGPVFTQILLADEINRASPRTQSALLEAMEEKQVSAAGVAHRLPRPFHVLATQNPLEYEGAYPLPEAQLDRFLMRIDMDFPPLDDERRILVETTSPQLPQASQVLTATTLLAVQRAVRAMPVGEDLLAAILALTRSLRPGGESGADVAWGPGPRAGQALMLACRARAALDGRFAPSMDDLAALAVPVMRHRMALADAEPGGGDLDNVISGAFARLKESPLR